LLDTDRHARVTAGPGAGKTYWLAEHIKNVIQRSKKLHPHARVGVISYTNIAADELKQKLGNDATRAITGTIHSFLYTNVIKPYIHLIRNADGLPVVNTTLMDGHDEHHVSRGKLDTWLASVNYRTVLRDKHQTGILREALASIRWEQHDDLAQWKLGIHSPEWIARQLWRPTQAKLTPDSLLNYKTLYWTDGVLDHDDVLYFATRIFHEYPLIVSCLSARYPFLFIDEFQDTVPAQTNIVRLLAAQGTTVVVIGDAEQSIFTFAGAQPEHFRTFTLPEIDEYTIANNRRSTNRIIALLNHVRSDDLIQNGVREQDGEPVQLVVGPIALAAQHVKSLLPQDEVLLIVARTGTLVQQAQLQGVVTTANPWDAIEAADGDRKIFLHQLLAGVVLARQHRYGTAVATILHGLRHTNGRLKEPLQSATPRTALQRRAIAITLLEALIKRGPTLDTITLRVAYDDCRTALNNSFQALTLKQIIRGAIYAATEQYTCDILLRAVKLTNTEEVRDARTIHQAKGTERPSVLACLEGRDDNETQTQINHILNPAMPSDEQQRVTYVAISRARDQLFLAAPTLTMTQEQQASELGIVVTRLDTE
jgi:DNA helicase-2/ATP-dependent DNA helicase PcrA